MRNRGPRMPPEHYHPTARPSALVIILGDLEAAGVRPTPLNVIARATDVGMSDAAISAIVDELASQRHLDEVAA